MVLYEDSNQGGVSILFDLNPTESVSSSVAAETFLTPSQFSDPLICEFLKVLDEGFAWILGGLFLQSNEWKWQASKEIDD